MLYVARVKTSTVELQLTSCTVQIYHHVTSCTIQPVTVVRDLGVLIKGELSTRQRVTRLSQTCFSSAPAAVSASTTRA